MANYVVAYDRRPGVDYEPLIELLESYPTQWHLQQSVWIVGPAESAYALATAVGAKLDEGDLLLVQALTEDAAWSGYTREGNEWIDAAAQAASR